MLSFHAIPGVGRQGSGYPVLCCAGWIQLECSWLHDVCFCICCTLPTFRSSQNLTAVHLYSLPLPQSTTPPHTSRCFLPPPTIRMQPLNPNPDNGKSARWSLFPVLHSHPHPSVSQKMHANSHPQTPSFKFGCP